mgnify:FL=1
MKEIMNIEDLKKEIKQIENKSDFIVSWYAKKYRKTIRRIGNLNKKGCRTWNVGKIKYMCFWDVVINRYTTCINPIITYKNKPN